MCKGLMSYRLCRYMLGINEMYCCVGICWGEMGCKLCRYMWGINEM